MTIKIEMLRCFAMVARHGGLSDAADALGRTPSAVSMMLRQFEDHIGAPLFETARKSRLTPLGALIYAEARREVTHFESTVSVIEGLARSGLGYLRLAVTPSVASAMLPPAIHDFVGAHPEVQIDIRDMESAGIAHELRQDRADIGIGTLPGIEGMQHTPLFSDAFGVVCRADHPLARRAVPVDWQDMAGHGFIANGLCDLITAPAFAPILAQSRLRVPNTASLLGLVRQGVGITILPRLAATGDGIAFVPLLDATVQRHVHVVSRPPALLMPAARAFLTLVQQRFQEN